MINVYSWLALNYIRSLAETPIVDESNTRMDLYYSGRDFVTTDRYPANITPVTDEVGYVGIFIGTGVYPIVRIRLP